MTLKDICLLIADCPHSTDSNEGTGYPLIRTPNIGRGRLILDGVYRVSKEVYDRRNRRAVPQDNDLIFAREAPAGNVAVVRGEKVCLGQRTVLLRPNREIADPDYLAYYLLMPEQQNALLGRANGATVPHVNVSVIRNLKVKLPPLSEQRKIANVLSAYDDLIENNQKQIKLLEEAAQRLYKEWFVDLRFPGHENVKIVDGVLEGWRKAALSNIVEFKRGKTITKAQIVQGDVPVVAGGLEPAYYHNIANTKMPVITVSGSGANAGFIRMYHANIFASDCSFADCTMTKYFSYVYCFLIDNKQQISSLQKGAAQPHVYAKDINDLVLLLPTREILNNFEKDASELFEKVGKLKKQTKYLKQARDALLPKLMSGEVEV